MKYSIVVPTYNHCDDLLKPCLESVFRYSQMSEVELIVSANGCTDHTWSYLQSLQHDFASIGMSDHLKVVWNDRPLGYARANNVAISQATCDKIVLLNNDVLLLPQSRNTWLNSLNTPFETGQNVGISCVVKSWSDPAAHNFAIFFCVMIHKAVFDRIGLLNEEYGTGGGEDTEFSIEAERAGFGVVECMSKYWNPQAHIYSGSFPIYHKGEGTVHDSELVPDWNSIFYRNSALLAKKYNPDWLIKQVSEVKS